MLILIETKTTQETLKKAAEDLDGYIKVVVDIEKGILTAGGKMHVEGEQLFLKKGSLQQNLWGGGYDMETKEIDFDSMINIRPNQSNTSREVLSQETRNKMEEIIKKLLT